MKCCFSFILLLLNIAISFGQLTKGIDISQLDTYSDLITLDSIIEFDSNKKFNTQYKNGTYRFLKDKEANWVKVTIDKQEKDLYLSIENSLFEELNFYIVNNSLKKEEHIKKDYRFPRIAIPKNITPCKVYIRSKDAKSYRTEFIIKVLNHKQSEAKIKKDYFFIGAYIIGLLVLLISATIIFVYKRKYAILWYSIHLTTLIIEYLISTGVFSEWFIDNSIVMKYGLDHVSLLISTMALSEFFRRFYDYNKKTIFCKQIYLAISIFCGIGAAYAIIDGLYGNIFNVELYAQTVLNYASLLSLIIHIILVLFRVIPVYLFVAFLLPVIGIFANLGDFKNQFENPNVTYFIFQSVYLGILIEVVVIIFYIIKQSVDGEILSIKLFKENNELKSNFQEKVLISQEQQQNELVNNVHDVFGGYIEALKLNLLQKELDEQNINSILDSFKKDYRFLLNSLYVPKVNSENFEEAIIDYTSKMNQLSKTKITFDSSKNEYTSIPQTIAKLVFLSASELTTNAIKYANAKHINLSLKLMDTNLILVVQDDGDGFDIHNKLNTSFGLKTIKERVENVNGVFDIKSKPGKGTQVTLQLNF